MLNIDFFTFNPFQENTYIITNEKNECWIIDPGMYDAREKAQMISFIKDKRLKPQSIINTHAHIDHVLGVQALKDEFNIPFGLHDADMPVLKMAAGSATLFGLDLKTPPVPEFFVKDGEPLKLGEDTLEVFFTPGHSPGSISFYYATGKWVISGDVLFSGSIGRTDLPGGNFDTLISSIRKWLFTLPDDTVVFSGHGPATQIGQEKKHNPFLQ
jgi:hydroxyacylglutathione hydrolase